MEFFKFETPGFCLLSLPWLEQDMSDAEFEKELDDIYDNFAAEPEQEPVSPDCQSDYESDMDTASSQSSDSESE
jgi:hypothetical protein